MDKILRVNTRSNDIRSEACSTEALRLGGRSLIAHLALKEIDPNCDPLGRKNKFILARIRIFTETVGLLTFFVE